MELLLARSIQTRQRLDWKFARQILVVCRVCASSGASERGCGRGTVVVEHRKEGAAGSGGVGWGVAAASLKLRNENGRRRCALVISLVTLSST